MRTQIAFRLDREKANQFKQKVESEGRSLNVVLESLVNTYLESGLTDVSNELTIEDSNAIDAERQRIEDSIATLTEKISQLEKQLTPVSELLAVTATDKDKLTPVNSEVTTNSRGCFGFAVNTLLTSGNNNQDANSKLTGGSKVEQVTSVNSELADANSKLTGGSNEKEVTSVNSENQKGYANNELTTVSTELTEDNNHQTVSTELAPDSTKSEEAPHLDSDNSKLAPVSNLEDESRTGEAITDSLPDQLSFPKLADAYGIARNTLSNWVNEIQRDWKLEDNGKWLKRK